MGEAKNKLRKPLTEAERASMLGTDPFKVAYDMIYEITEEIYKEFGHVDHELLGIDFKDGVPSGVHTLPVRRVEDVADLRDRMLVTWPMVIHVCEAWASTDPSCAPSQSPDRQDVVMITLHTDEYAATAKCVVNEQERTIQRSELVMPTEMKGRLGRELPKRPLSS